MHPALVRAAKTKVKPAFKPYASTPNSREQRLSKVKKHLKPDPKFITQRPLLDINAPGFFKRPAATPDAPGSQSQDIRGDGEGVDPGGEDRGTNIAGWPMKRASATATSTEPGSPSDSDRSSLSGPFSPELRPHRHTDSLNATRHAPTPLPAPESPSTRIRLAQVNFEAIPTMFSSGLNRYRAPGGLFSLMNCPAERLPPHPPHPFPILATGPLGGPSKDTIGPSVVRFGLMASKTVSKFATERNRVKSRFKAAVDTVLRETRAFGSAQGAAAADAEATHSPSLLSPNRVYVAVLSGGIYNAPMSTLVASVREGLDRLSRIPFARSRLPMPDKRKGKGAGKRSGMAGGVAGAG